MQWVPRAVSRRPDPHWLENINVNNELVYRYQVDAKHLSDVLTADKYALQHINQVRI